MAPYYDIFNIRQWLWVADFFYHITVLVIYAVHNIEITLSTFVLIFKSTLYFDNIPAAPHVVNASNIKFLY